MSSIVHIGAPYENLQLTFLDAWGQEKTQMSTFSFVGSPRVQITHYKDIIDSDTQWFFVINYQNPDPAITNITPEIFPEDVLDSIKNHNCTLLLTNYAESYFEDSDLIHAHKLLSNLIHNLGIPSHKIKWITNCIGGQEIFDSFCQRHQLDNPGCSHITFVEFLIPLSPHWDLLNVPKRRFIFLQKGDRDHRMALAMLMFKNQINAHMSFHYDENTHSVLLWLAQKKYPNTGLQESDVDAFCATLPRKVDNVSLTENNAEHLNAYANTELLLATERSGIYVIGETRFDEPGIFFSEKTMKAIMNKKPFILLGQPNSCKELSKLGFKTFHPYIDESYDSIEDPEQRLLAVSNEIHRLYNLPNREFYGMIAEMNDICEYNFNQIRHFGQKAIDLDKIIGKL